MVFQWSGVSFARAIQLHIKSFEHSIQVAGNIRIPEADYPESLLLQPRLPFAIALGDCIIVVMSAIQFNDQAFCRTEEVYDIRPYRRLTPKMCALYR